MRFTSYREVQATPAQPGPGKQLHPAAVTAGQPTLLSSLAPLRQAGLTTESDRTAASAPWSSPDQATDTVWGRPFRRTRLLRLRSQDGALLSMRVPVTGSNQPLLRRVRAAELEAWKALEEWESPKELCGRV